MIVRTVLAAIAALLFAACGSSTEPVGAETAGPEPEPRATEASRSADDAELDPSDGEIKDWCEHWYADVVDERVDGDPDVAVGAAFLLAAEGVDLDDDLLSSAAEVIDYASGPSATAEQIEQALDEIELACSVYITID